MTVGAVVVGAEAAEALADAAGRPAALRIVEAAWAGGALPIVVVADDAQGALAAALGGTPARLVVPDLGGAGASDEAARAALGCAAAREAVRETDALILWPLRMTWVDPETVTSLIEGHGVRPEAILRPCWEGAPAWPVLVPSASLDAVLGGAAGDLESALRGSGLPVHLLELGDPGTAHDRSRPLGTLPAYEGPAEPVGGPPPEWGAAAAERSDEGPGV